ncbi:MAG: PAS domain-containing protein [Proteobacteria bacterium]|nr:PAS domain-containing protein [Pseudomonadota bacterium]
MPKARQPTAWDYCGVEALVAAPVKACHAYWLSKAKDGRLPSRADIDPVECRAFLPYCIMLEVEGPGRFVYRIFGSHLAEVALKDLTGLRLDSAALGESAPLFQAAYERVCADKAVVAFKGHLFWQDRSHRTFEQVSLPLSSDGVAVDKIFCAALIAPARS